MLDVHRPEDLEQAAEILRDGGLVVLPTDTVYGLAASLRSPGALARIFAIKGRSERQPLPVLLGSLPSLDHVSPERSDRVLRLMRHFWPGPLTVVVPARSGLPARVVGPGATVGVRVPADQAARRLLDLSGGALAVTSANRSGNAPALDAQTALEALGAGVDAILDGGRVGGGVASTVVRVIGDDLEILRIGALDPAKILRRWSPA